MIINDLDALENFATNLSKVLDQGDVINLIGEMGAGKTTLTNYLAKAYGISDSSSPTFAIVNIYEGAKKIYHLDLYRLNDPDEILDIDFETYFYPDDGLTIIEWAENATGYLPSDMISIEITKLDYNGRAIEILNDSTRGRELNEYFGN